MRDRATKPDPTYSTQQVLTVMLIFITAPIALMLALSYPVTAAGVILTAVSTALVVTISLDARHKRGATRRVCLPLLGVCFEV